MTTKQEELVNAISDILDKAARYKRAERVLELIAEQQQILEQAGVSRRVSSAVIGCTIEALYVAKCGLVNEKGSKEDGESRIP